jgi:hypothetical protein
MSSAELYNIPDDYQSDIEIDYTETLETKRRQAVRSRLSPFSCRCSSLLTLLYFPFLSPPPHPCLQLSALDPIRTAKLSSSIGQKLSEAQALNGGPDAFQQQWLGKVDPLLVEELVKRLEGTLKG